MAKERGRSEGGGSGGGGQGIGDRGSGTGDGGWGMGDGWGMDDGGWGAGARAPELLHEIHARLNFSHQPLMIRVERNQNHGTILLFQ